MEAAGWPVTDVTAVQVHPWVRLVNVREKWPAVSTCDRMRNRAQLGNVKLTSAFDESINNKRPLSVTSVMTVTTQGGPGYVWGMLV